MGEWNSRHNRLVWFDLPVADLDRAVAFYADLLDCTVSKERFGEIEFAVIEHEHGNGGCLVVKPDEIGEARGVLVYLNCDGRIREAVTRVPGAGGRVLEDVHPIGPHGFRAIVRDSEGNRIALHSNADV